MGSRGRCSSGGEQRAAVAQCESCTRVYSRVSLRAGARLARAGASSDVEGSPHPVPRAHAPRAVARVSTRALHLHRPAREECIGDATEEGRGRSGGCGRTASSSPCVARAAASSAAHVCRNSAAIVAAVCFPCVMQAVLLGLRPQPPRHDACSEVDLLALADGHLDLRRGAQPRQPAALRVQRSSEHAPGSTGT